MPLAHILAPQIAKRAEEIEAELGYRPEGLGYLGNAGTAAPSAAAPAKKKPLPKGGTASDRALKELRSRPQKRPDQVFLDAAVRGAHMQELRQREMQAIPNAPGAGQSGAPIGMNERGEPIYGAAPMSGRIQLPAGPIGMSESGQAVDRRGRTAGYLGQPGVRTAERQPSDVGPGLTYKYGNQDRYGGDQMQRKYGEHLKAMQENRNPDGTPTDKFPPGYFEGMTKKQRQDIETGVEALRRTETGVRA